MREFLEGQASEDAIRLRQAAEKAWLAANEAVDAFLARRNKPVPRGAPEAHGFRLTHLEGEGQSWAVDKLSSFADSLHGQCFYAGECGPWVRRKIEEAQAFVRRLESL